MIKLSKEFICTIFTRFSWPRYISEAGLLALCPAPPTAYERHGDGHAGVVQCGDGRKSMEDGCSDVEAIEDEGVQIRDLGMFFFKGKNWRKFFFLIMGGNSWYRGVGHKGVMLNQSFFFFKFLFFCFCMSNAKKGTEVGVNLQVCWSRDLGVTQEICWFAEWKLWKPCSDPFWQIKQQIFLVSLFHKIFLVFIIVSHLQVKAILQKTLSNLQMKDVILVTSAKKTNILTMPTLSACVLRNPRISFLTIPTSAPWPAKTETGVAPYNSSRNSAEIVCPLQWSRQVRSLVVATWRKRQEPSPTKNGEIWRQKVVVWKFVTPVKSIQSLDLAFWGEESWQLALSFAKVAPSNIISQNALLSAMAKGQQWRGVGQGLQAWWRF